MIHIWMVSIQPDHSFFFIFFGVRLLAVRFFHPRHNGQWSQTSKDFYTRSYPLHYFLILILEKEPIFPFSMLSAKQGKSVFHFNTNYICFVRPSQRGNTSHAPFLVFYIYILCLKTSSIVFKSSKWFLMVHLSCHLWQSGYCGKGMKLNIQGLTQYIQE